MPRTTRQPRDGEPFLLEATSSLAIANWAAMPTPRLPPVWRRKKSKLRGASMVLCRDTSTSMGGARATWAASVAKSIFHLGEREGMQVGYLEFSDGKPLAPCEGFERKFFRTRADDDVLRAASAIDCTGLTDYSEAISAALERLASASGGSRSAPKHILLITDGAPTSGGRDEASMLSLASHARRLNVCVHAIHIGAEEEEEEGGHAPSFPASLAALTARTGGARLMAHERTRKSGTRSSFATPVSIVAL